VALCEPERPHGPRDRQHALGRRGEQGRHPHPPENTPSSRPSAWAPMTIGGTSSATTRVATPQRR
jgi:hypothetical protein